MSIPHHFRIALRVKLSRFLEVEGTLPKQVPASVLGVGETLGQKLKTCGAFLMGSTVIMKWVEADMELPIGSCYGWNHMYAEMMWTGAQKHLTQSTPHAVQLCSCLHTVPSTNDSSRSRLVAIFTRDLINRLVKQITVSLLIPQDYWSSGFNWYSKSLPSNTHSRFSLLLPDTSADWLLAWWCDQDLHFWVV